MMNLLAIGLVLTSVVTAGFFTPTAKTGEEDVIVKDGHRVVVVEYEKDDGSTKVLISPPNSPETDDGKQDEADRHGFRPRELVCDAYGKCKHKIAAAFEKTTGKAAETAEAAKDATERFKETITQTASEASDKVKEVTETLSEKGGGLKEEAARKMEGAKERVKGTVSQTASEAFDKVKEVTETLSEKGGGLKEAAGRKMEGAKETVAEKAKAVEEGVDTSRRKRKEAEKELREILQNAGEVADDVLHYVARRERAAPWAAVLHLMGFAAAYGMSLWITFASSYVLAGALPKQQFAVVQSKIYPVYFKAMASGVGMVLLGHLMGGGRRSVVVVQGMNLVSSMAMILMNLLWLEPKATKVMLERMKKEKEEGAGKESHPATTTTTRAVDDTAGRGLARARIMELSQILQRQNSYSSFLNALTLVSLTWHLVHLGQRLQRPC